MIVVYPEFFQGSQIVGKGSSPSRLCQSIGVNVTNTVGIVVGRLIVRFFSQANGLLGADKPVPAGLQFLQGHDGVFCLQALYLLGCQFLTIRPSGSFFMTLFGCTMIHQRYRKLHGA